MARAATSAGDMEYASDLTVENNPLPQKEEGKEESKQTAGTRGLLMFTKMQPSSLDDGPDGLYNEIENRYQ